METEVSAATKRELALACCLKAGVLLPELHLPSPGQKAQSWSLQIIDFAK
jgi:hypothetical protein